MVVIPTYKQLAPHFSTIEVSGITFYYSYDILIAVRTKSDLLVCKNDWSKTTGKHLNEVCADKKIRLSREEFLGKVNQLKEA